MGGEYKSKTGTGNVLGACIPLYGFDLNSSFKIHHSKLNIPGCKPGMCWLIFGCHYEEEFLS